MRRSAKSDARYVEVRLRKLALERQERVVLEDVSWTIKPGERWVLVGGNGAGKTQLLKIIAGAVWPTPGAAGTLADAARRYHWRNEVFMSPFEVKEEIGYLGPERQDKYARYGWNHTVEQIVGTGRYRTDIPLDPLTVSDRRRVAALLKRLAIAHLASRTFLSLSYGERRLTLLARALASRPKLLLMDELLGGLDETNHGRALRWLYETKRARMPWVLATHRVEDVPDSATHALVLETGRVVYRGVLRGAPLQKWLNREPPARVSTSLKRTVRRHDSAPLVRLERASVYLDEQQVLTNLSFEVRPGDCWVIHGHNGSGKTTLLRTLYGDHGVASGGRIKRAGITPGVPLQEFKERVGIVAPHLQTDHPQEFTVAAVVQSGRYASIGLNDAPTAADRAAARRSLDFFGLADFASRTLKELSYGQLRRVLFARAWTRHPDLLLLDEPFSGIDSPTRLSLMAHVGAMTASGTAVVMATHHREEWLPCVTNELELAAGRAIYCGPVRSAAAHGSGRSVGD